MAKLVESTTALESLSKANLDLLTPEGYLNSLTPKQIGVLFSQLDQIEKFFSGVRKIIEKEVKEGTKIPGVKLVLSQGKPTEGFVQDEEQVIQKLHEMGYTDEQIMKPSTLIAWTNIKNLVKTAGVKELKEAGLVGMVEKAPVEKVVYTGFDLEEQESIDETNM